MSELSAPRHLLYATHFPLPQEEFNGPFGSHEGNQRTILLFGVGRSRDDARHQVKKINREVTKLFSKKFSIDVSEGGFWIKLFGADAFSHNSVLKSTGGKVKKLWRTEFNWDGLVTRFNALSYYDQHQVVIAGNVAMREMLYGFSMGPGMYLPLIDHVAHLTQLMESCLYVTGLLEFCNQVGALRRSYLKVDSFVAILLLG